MGGVAGVALVAIGVAIIVATDGIASPVGTAIISEAGALIATTGITVVECAAEESAMVIDVSASDSNGVKVGGSVVIDFEKNTFDFYDHDGYTSSNIPSVTYAVGKVHNYENVGDYAGPFVNGGATYSWLGVDYCRSPDWDLNSVSATSITFSFFGVYKRKAGLYAGWDYYRHIGAWGD